ncbi:2OG-Fe dioxygenase family protein [Vibrio hepatarius]|uniref:2OG-Fe dioxygenase family protein n=1 Tax=Vibrio hepatarius TaxID=171383 RepID=UPI00142DE3F6|nr:2OG-Fe dioxygenase family protein [Vibrio hepatarius]NIY81463.1 agglutination protein [Vibrio hepatarius]NVJ57320.1 2OG-Fe dioxygenase family protein [Vibrionaceae bacterium]
MMLHNRETTLQLTKLSENAISQLAPSFSKLPSTEHADGKYRLRRYSVIQFKGGQVIDLQKNEFMQTDDINRFQGNVVRQFEPVEKSTLECEGMREICQVFVEANKLSDGQEIEIHQIRISAIYDETQVAPEGVHQDGFEHIALIGMGRHNVEGGDIMLYNSFNEAPFFRKVLQNGEIAMLADNKLWHNATPIKSVIDGQEGYMDVFVLTAKEAVNELHS